MDNERSGDGWWVITFVIGILALIMGVVGIAIASGKSNVLERRGQFERRRVVSPRSTSRSPTSRSRRT